MAAVKDTDTLSERTARHPIFTIKFVDSEPVSCAHTFCYKCLKSITEWTQEKQEHKFLSCPLCKKEILVHRRDEASAEQKYDLMENLLKLKAEPQIVFCDMCNMENGETGREISKVPMGYLQHKVNCVDECVKVREFHRMKKDEDFERNIDICDNTMSFKRSSSTKYCTRHPLKQLDCYCVECKIIVCISCFVENQNFHVCQDVASVVEECCQIVVKSAWKISGYADEMMSLRKKVKRKKSDFLQSMVAMEKEIQRMNEELKKMIDRDTNLLLNELSGIKSKQLERMDTELVEIDKSCKRMRLFESFCAEQRSNGSASVSNIWSSISELTVLADTLEREHELLTGRPHRRIDVSFQATDSVEVLQKFTNIVGQIKETTVEFETNAIILAVDDDPVAPYEVMKINLHRSNEISTLKSTETAIDMEVAAAVYCNTIYLTGIGDHFEDIWKYNVSSGWIKCASLVQGRRRHSAAFFGEVLYICGGVGDVQNQHRQRPTFLDRVLLSMIPFGEVVHTSESVLHSVEAYNTATSECKTVGRLFNCVHSAGNCVPFQHSLYIFGGADEGHRNVSTVQAYNACTNTCTLLTTRMPSPHRLMRAVLWKTCAVLIGCRTCFIYDFETGTWKERNRFRTDAVHFGLVLENKRVFVLGGGLRDKENARWKYRDDVRYVPIQRFLEDKLTDWKIHATLPKPCLVHACGKIRTSV